MILKEAFRTQNHLGRLLAEATYFLDQNDNVTSTKEEHYRKAANPSAENETINRKHQTDMEPNTVIDLVAKLLSEKQKLTDAISKAKASADIDMDGAIAANKERQMVLRTLRGLATKKSTEEDTSFTGYMINNEGDQTPYRYDGKVIKTIDFDRNNVRALIQKYQRECDEASAKIDLLNLTLEVNYTPVFEISTSFEEAYEIFSAEK